MQRFDNWQSSIYLQDLITLNQDWKLLAGFRQSWVDSTSLDTQNSPLPMSANQAATTPRFGAVYQPFADASAYVAYSQSFQPVVGASRLGAPFGPESGEAYEIGLKYEIVRRRLWATLAAFDIFRQNVIVPDPVDPNFNTQVSEVESRGVEFDLMGQVTERWSVIANAAYLHTEITQDTQANLLGNRADNVPYFSSNIWTRYNIQQTADRTTGLATACTCGGSSGRHREQLRPPPITAGTPASTRRGHSALSLYAENLFDTFYIASAPQRRTQHARPLQPRGGVGLIY
ncbi:MAG: TonB-dependent receptor [Pirellulaceae bacterium]